MVVAAFGEWEQPQILSKERIVNILKNHKRTIATMAGPVLAWAIAKGWIDSETSTLLATLLTVWSGVAVSHAAIKSKKQ